MPYQSDSLFLIVFLSFAHLVPVYGSGLDSRPVNTSCFAPDRPIPGFNVTLQHVFAQLFFPGPVALLQPVYAAFLRDGWTRREGSLSRAADEPVRSDLPTALVGIVCRRRSGSGHLQVERRLVGEDSVDFPRLDLDLGRDLCAIVSDVIPAGTMTEGMFKYELLVHGEDDDAVSKAREFAALGTDW